jgi:macrodomain Ter protein organizer (MatP/YcbG family)
MQNNQQIRVKHARHINTSHSTTKKKKYLPFFWKAFLREPLAIYSVTVATEPPGPSRTTP